MSNMNIEQSICQAIEIITGKRISEASFDKTIKAQAVELLDSSTGEYKIKYQDSTFTAYAINSNADYTGKEVFILIPGNDMQRVKTIIGVTTKDIQTDNVIANAKDLYNQVGPNLANGRRITELKSSKDTLIDILYSADDVEEDSSTKEREYICNSSAIAVSMNLRTDLSSGQVGGDYGVVFELEYQDSANGGAATRRLRVSSNDVMGNPYAVGKQTLVERLYTNTDNQYFKRIKSIIAYSQGFPQTATAADIFISGIKMNGADPLTQDQLQGYSLFIDGSKNGYSITNQIPSIELDAQLKVKGKRATQNVLYYWFIENGLVYRGHEKYFAYAGDGWECINLKGVNGFVGRKDPTFIFTGSAVPEGVTEGMKQIMQDKIAIRCVAMFDSIPIVGDYVIYNKNITNGVYIDSSDKDGEGNNKEVYYLNNGHPTFTCRIKNQQEKENPDYSLYTFTWAVTPAKGRSERKANTEESVIQDYNKKKEEYEQVKAKAERVQEKSRKAYIQSEEYKNAKAAWEEVENLEIITDNVYEDFSISSIVDYSTITCAIVEKSTELYLGTARITIQNKLVPEGSYSLIINHGDQTFQYDSKGNSPANKTAVNDKPLEIKPLGFTFIDNTGKQISFKQIVNANGIVKWYIPKEDISLLRKIGDATQEGNFYVVKDVAELPFTIADEFDSTKSVNYIQLSIDYKGLHFDSYTNFSIPKNGDPGTNGTDYFVRIVPMRHVTDEKTGEIKEVEQITDNIYLCRNSETGDSCFSDQGNDIEYLKFKLYNKGTDIPLFDEDEKIIWQCPPGDSTNKNTWIDNTSWSQKRVDQNLSLKTGSLTYEEPLINIARAKYTMGSKQDKDLLTTFTEYPICIEFIEGNYRIKVKPKTGFLYVTYAADGTSPDYDDTLPFELIIEQYLDGYYVATEDKFLYNWSVVGNLKEIEVEQKTLSTLKAVPKDFFTGEDLTSKVICEVKKETDDEEISIGTIYIPIYMHLNRYGHQALNDWDGNSINLGDNGETILAPQIGAGRKDGDNGFTGLFMGNVKSAKEQKVGLFGYNDGVQSIFLDAESGKAEFGSKNKGQITIDPRNETAQIYSGNYPTDPDTGEKAGMMIDLSQPFIKFGTGNFEVNADGSMIAKGSGQIAGWNIGADKLYKGGVSLNSDNAASTNLAIQAKNKNDQTVFSVDYEGNLHSKAGDIAGWNINSKALWKPVQGNETYHVGINSDPNNATYSVSNHKARAFFANGNNFYVTHDGYLRSTSGRIANWNISSTALTNGNVGLGSTTILSTVFNTSSNFDARIWHIDNNSPNFAVSNTGDLYSKSGKIGGWTLDENTLYAGSNNPSSTFGIRLDSSGNLSGGKSSASTGSGNNHGWSIGADGEAVFNGIQVNNAAIGTGYFGLRNSRITIDGNTGTITGDNFSISPSQAEFNGLKVQNGKITTSGSGGSGGSWTPSGGLRFPSSDIHVGENGAEYDLSNYLSVKVKDLVVQGVFTYQNHPVKITEKTVVTEINPYGVAHGSRSIILPTEVDSEGKITQYLTVPRVITGVAYKDTKSAWLTADMPEERKDPEPIVGGGGGHYTE